MESETEELQKINIVCSGGEMRGGFVGGCLDALMHDIDLDQYQITFYCVSAGAVTALYYLSHGMENFPGRQIWTDKLSKEGKCVYNGFLKIDFSGIIRVFKDNPFDVEKILNNQHEIIFSIYNLDKKRIDYVSSKKRPGYIWMGDYDIYTLVSAATAAPVLYGKSVKVGKYNYCDPGLIQHCIFPDNSDKTVFVLQNKNIATSKFLFISIALYSIFSKTLPYFWFSFFVFHERKVYKQVKKLVKMNKAILIEPVRKLKGGVNMSLSSKDLTFNYKIGEKAYAKNAKRVAFFLKPNLK